MARKSEKRVKDFIIGSLIVGLVFMSFISAVNVNAATRKAKSVIRSSAAADSTVTKELVRALEKHESKVTLKTGSIKYTADNINDSAAQVGNYLEKVLDDNPQLFYTVSYGVSFCPNMNSKTVTTITPKYTMTASEAIAASAKFKKAAKKIEKQVSKKATTKQKAKKVNDILKKTVRFGESSNRQNAYGALVQHKGVCQAYAMAYEYIMRDLGVKTTIQYNNARSHVWNKVCSGGKWHHVDVAWNDTGKTNKYFWTKSHEM